MKTSPSDNMSQKILQELHHLNEKIDNVSVDLRGEIASLDRKMESSFSDVNDKISGLNDKIESVHAETLEALHVHANQTDAHFMLVDNRLTRVESRMVTRDYLDDKMADQYSKVVEHTTRKIEKAMG